MQMRKKLLKRFAVVATVSILLTAVFMTAAFWVVFSKQESSDLAMLAQTIAKTYDVDKVKSLESIISNKDVRVTFIAPDGSVIYDSKSDASLLTNHNDRPEFKEALENGVGISSRMSLTLNSNTYYYAIKTDGGNVLRVAKTYGSVISVFLKILPVIIFIILIVFVICIALSRRATRKIIEPIENMSENLQNTPYEEIGRAHV